MQDELDMFIQNAKNKMSAIELALLELSNGDMRTLDKNIRVRIVDTNNRLIYGFKNIDEMLETTQGIKSYNVVSCEHLQNNYNNEYVIKVENVRG